MTTVQSQIKQLHQSLVENFQIIRSENDEIFRRLEKIEQSLDKDKENHSKETKTKKESERDKIHGSPAVRVEGKTKSVEQKKISKSKVAKTEKKKKCKTTKIENDDNIKEDNKGEEEEDSDEDQELGVPLYEELSSHLKADDDTVEEPGPCLDDGQRHDVEVKMLPEKAFEGFCFRPIAGWKNPDGAYEISKEVIEFTDKLVNEHISLDHNIIIIITIIITFQTQIQIRIVGRDTGMK